MATDANGVTLNVGDHVVISARVLVIENDDISLGGDTGSTVVFQTDTGVQGTSITCAASSVVKQ